MNSSLTGDYLRWMSPQVGNVSRSAKTYEALIRLMFGKEFVWLVGVGNDDNRAADGLDIRAEFCHDRNIPLDSLSCLGPASFLEVLIGLSRRLAFLASGSAESWAWQLVENLELHKFNDPLGRTRSKRAEDLIDACIWRTYRPNGYGGFFPLAWPEDGVDMTKVDLWYQMHAYINEQHQE